MSTLDLPRCHAPSRRQLEVEEAASWLTPLRNQGGLQGSSDLAGVVDGRRDRVRNEDGLHDIHSDDESNRNGGGRLESGLCDMSEASTSGSLAWTDTLAAAAAVVRSRSWLPVPGESSVAVAAPVSTLSSACSRRCLEDADFSVRDLVCSIGFQQLHQAFEEVSSTP
ncbi:hypothetical protein MRX96_025490 [Rhipicephalus microplus]